MAIYDNPRSRSFIDLCPWSKIQHFQTSFPKKNSRPFEAKFHMEPPLDVGTKICSIVLGHMTRPIYVKNLQNLLRNQEADDLETWYAVSGTQVLPTLFR